MPEYTEDQLENLFAHFAPDTLRLMKRDVEQLIQDEVDLPSLEWYNRLRIRVVHMIEEKRISHL